MTTFTHYREPYGTVVFEVESAIQVEPVPQDNNPRWGISSHADYINFRAENGWIDLKGTVIRGHERNRLLGSVSFTDLVGQPYSLCVSPEDFASGNKRTVAM